MYIDYVILLIQDTWNDFYVAAFGTDINQWIDGHLLFDNAVIRAVKVKQ